ncbi:MAG: hypothetical protein LBM27_03000 [Lactobacillaceae bacterium]|jgi:hypothetical protein|nr:hypothetical protein [Lactobacillaceae bacterium]
MNRENFETIEYSNLRFKISVWGSQGKFYLEWTDVSGNTYRNIIDYPLLKRLQDNETNPGDISLYVPKVCEW